MKWYLIAPSDSIPWIFVQKICGKASYTEQLHIWGAYFNHCDNLFQENDSNRPAQITILNPFRVEGWYSIFNFPGHPHLKKNLWAWSLRKLSEKKCSEHEENEDFNPLFYSIEIGGCGQQLQIFEAPSVYLPYWGFFLTLLMPMEKQVVPHSLLTKGLVWI